MEQIFLYVYSFFKKQRIVFWLILTGTIAFLSYFALQVKLEEDITKMFPTDEKSEKSNFVFKNTQFLDRLIINISQKDTALPADPDKLVEYASQLEESLKQDTFKLYIKDIQAKVEEETIFEVQNSIYNNLPFFLNKEDYKSIDKLITDKQIDSTLEGSYKILLSPSSVILKKFIIQDPAGIASLALTKLQGLQLDDDYDLYEGYIFSKDKKHLLFFITSAYPPNESAGNAMMINALDDEIKKQNNNSKEEVNAEYFGAPAVSVANASRIKSDVSNTLTIAVCLILLILWLYFRNIAILPIILLPAIFGGLFSMAMIYFIKGKISAIATGAGAVVLGVAVDYSLHIIVHYKHTGSMQTVIKDVAMAILVGCITTVGAFFCLLFVEAELLQDFGLFAGFTLLGAALFSLLFMPQFISSKVNSVEKKQFPIFQSTLWKKIKLPSIKPGISFLIIIILTLGFAYTSQYAGFESNMMKLNYMSPQLKTAEQNLNKINIDTIQPIYMVFSGKNLNEALTNNEKTLAKIRQFEKQGNKLKYAGVNEIVTSDSVQKERLAQWNNYWTSEKKTQLKSRLDTKAKKLGFKDNSFNGFYTLLDTKFEAIDTEAVNNLKSLILKNNITEEPEITTVLAGIKIGSKDKPALMKILDEDQNVTVADKQGMASKFIEIVNSDLNLILTMSSVLVFGILLISYGRLELALITFIPMMITWVWILGIMGIFGIKFNIINIIISTFIFGLGDDYSIFISDGLLEEYKTSRKNLPSFKISIILSAITTIIGVGVLIFAQHPAIRSIALISIIGIVCTVIISYSVIPFLYQFLILNRKVKGQPPITFSLMLSSFGVYTTFLLGCLIMVPFGFVLFTIFRLKGQKVKLFYHYMLMYFARSLTIFTIHLKRNIMNTTGEDFSKQAVVICNHQSFVDIILCLTLHPKMIFVTNDWVWNSPFFGSIVQYADFQTSSNGMEESFNVLSQRVKEGYSILVFPEGTRSPESEILRFHKGAFYLAEQLKLDLLPVIIHGTGDIVTKGDDLVMKKGIMTAKILPRIAPDSTKFSANYSERSKQVRNYFKDEYEIIKGEIETPEYFYARLIRNYIYKGPIIEWYAKIKVKIEDEYAIFQKYIPMKGNIVDIGCGYGFLSYLLSYKSKERNILGIDYDAEKIEVANNCYSKIPQVNFISADISSYTFDQTDAFTIIDVLHYMREEEQKALISKCLENLNPGGIIIIRDSDPTLQKHGVVAFMEFFSTRLGFNKTVGYKLRFISSEELTKIAKEHHASIEQIHHGKKSSNSIYVIRQM
jgi:1-acyl-sn-glycerol-3-phosphate acyltransferase